MNQPVPAYHLEPIAPPSHVAYAHKNGRGLLTFQQIAELVKSINGAYVATKRGGMSYLSQHQARAEMNRIFGYGNWDVIEGDPVLLYEETKESNGTKYIACYRASVTIDVRDLWGMPVCTVTGTHAEANANLPDRSEAHAMAITSVMSYALRRALINLGDRFGLGLYNGGSQAAHGQYTIQQYEGQLGTWVPDEAEQPQQPQAIVTHETIQAEPVISDDGTNPNWVDPNLQQQRQAPQQQVATQQQQGYQQAPQQQQPQQQQAQAPTQPTQQGGMPEFHQAQETMQQGRQEYRQQYAQQAPQGAGQQPPQFDPNILAQAQGGFKVDGQ